jgi:hypothetical protein
MNYQDALNEADRMGASKAEGLPLLAQTIATLSLCHAINAEATFNGAVKMGLTAIQVSKLHPVALGDLMFV